METFNTLQAVQVFGGALAQSLSASFTQRLELPWKFHLVETSKPAPKLETEVVFRISAQGGLRGECNLMMDSDAVAALGAKLLREPPSVLEARYRDALKDLLSSAMEELGATLVPQFGSITFSVEQMERQAHEEPAVSLEATSDDGSLITCSLDFSKELLEAMTSAASSKGTGRGRKSGVDPTNLQLVMDVELNVSLRFGQCQLPLREVLDLASGSVIELDRDVDDPVELLLDGKVIARGEAVIVDGNYGLRVTEIPEPIASHLGG
ncbi:MAG: flagellar motor switch protein FliN [Acidobacteriaceae bacterium]